MCFYWIGLSACIVPIAPLKYEQTLAVRAES
jgi:hypothetical protein